MLGHFPGHYRSTHGDRGFHFRGHASLLDVPDPRWLDQLGQAAASYSSANLLLRQAFVERAGMQPGQAIALIELAKELYRDVLRADPQHWDSRYNLDRAQRLLPDPDEALEAAPPDINRNAERAATTMRGYSPGLPWARPAARETQQRGCVNDCGRQCAFTGTAG